MLKLNKDQKRLPIGGHHYTEHGKTLRGDGVPDLTRQLAAFRLSNNINAGNPEQEILTFYAKNWPWMVKEDRETDPIVEDSEYKAWREWVHDVWRHPPKKLLTTKEATERWNVCLECPSRKSFGWASTDEFSELVRRAYILRRGIETPLKNQFCSCHQVDLGVFVFLDKPSDFSNRKTEKPSNCWVT